MQEELAELCHSQWSGWMEYLFDKCEINDNNECVVPSWAVERWTRQMETPYYELSEEEKESDRKEADRFLAIINKHNW